MRRFRFAHPLKHRFVDAPEVPTGVAHDGLGDLLAADDFVPVLPTLRLELATHTAITRASYVGKR